MQQHDQGHLHTFTSIITLMAAQSPNIKNQLNALREGVIQWYRGVQNKIIEKNREIMRAKTRGNNKLAALFNEIQIFFETLLKNYSDPNLPVFLRKFRKIKQDFQFIDTDFTPFLRFISTQTQTQFQKGTFFGADIQHWLNKYEQKQNELDRASVQMQSLKSDKKILGERIDALIVDFNNFQQIKNEYLQKIGELQGLLEKAEQQIKVLKVNQKRKNNVTFRSSPEINTWEKISNNKTIRQLINHNFVDEVIDRRDEQVSIVLNEKHSDMHLLRFIFCQASTLQSILDQRQQIQ